MITRALRERPGLPAPSTRYLLARDGTLEVDESLPGPRVGPEHTGHDAIPPLLALVRHSDDRLHYLVVETGRDGAEVRRERAGRIPELVEEIEGRTDALPKVHAGGLSEARYQRTSEEIWKLNQREVADTVNALVRENAPAFLIVSGDVRARQLLRDELSDAARRLVVDVEAHTRAAGADDGLLDSAIAEELESHHDEAVADASDRADVDNGRRGAHGIPEIVAALQQAQVETLLLDARLAESDQLLDALEAPPWVGSDDDLDVGIVARVPAAEALVRAAILTDARILIAGDEPDAEDAPREHRAPRPPLAVLRWPR
ncbi:Vms1/Ankzf1 family peptidyl-tRNA hydrolase [Microbacterium sp.]|uniref:baeRF2 domain-containing protein n=1 Tax=Microbacterium sp. TaxID=51671 RepID=UPI0026044DD0|nr:Vms1/Ankzf1 family peptidyl-tRNA hydrolase [Microbacterium sp.]